MPQARRALAILGALGVTALAACGGHTNAGTATSRSSAARATVAGPADTTSDTAPDTSPDTAAPDTAAPDTAAPDTAAPDTAAPATTAKAGKARTTTSTAPAPTDSTTAAPAPGDGSLAPLPNGSAWTVVARIGDRPVVWKAQSHPLGSSAAASVAVFDQTRLTAALFNGPLIPGGTGWHNGDHVSSGALPALVAAFNGGFEFRHIQGGYMTEGRVMKPLKAQQMTLGIRRDGRLVLGVYGRDIVDDGSWVSLRQNLPPVVLDGKVVIDRAPGTYWGDNLHHVLSSQRSALCTRADGRLMYVFIGMVDINQLADALVAMGCRTAMQLDMNGTWPQFDTFAGFGSSQRSGILLDSRMKHPDRYLTGSQKDFIALFDPSTLPAGVLG